MSLEQMIEVEKWAFVEAIGRVDSKLKAWVEKRLTEGFTVEAIKDALAVSLAAAKTPTPTKGPTA